MYVACQGEKRIFTSWASLQIMLKADSVNLSKSKSGGNLEAPIRECGGVNAVHREHAQVIFEMVMADKVQRVVHVPEAIRAHVALDGLFMLGRAVRDPDRECGTRPE